MWREYAQSIGVGERSLTLAQKRQAEVNGILKETRFQTGDAAKLVTTYSGQIALLGYNFQNLKVQVGNALIPIAQAVLPGINAIIAGLTKLATVFAQVTALLFGKSSQVTQTSGVAASASSASAATDKLAESLGGAGDAAKKAGKDMKSVTAPFDEFNILADSAASSVGDLASSMDLGGTEAEIPEVETGGELFADAEISPKLLSAIDDLRKELEWLKDTAKRVWGVFAQSWEESGGKVIEAAKAALLSVWELIKSVANAFANIWTNGTGLEILNTIYSIISNVLNIVSELADRFREAWEANGNGEAIWQSLLNIALSYLDLVERIKSATLKWAQELNLEPLVTAFRGLLETIEPLVSVITDGLAWAYENVLLPFGKWFLEDLSPVAIETLTSAIGFLTEVIKLLQPFATWLWENFLQPIAQWTGELIISALKEITDRFNALSTWISEHRGELEKFFEPFGKILETISESVQKLVEDITALYDEHIRPFIDSVKQSFNEWFDTMLDGWNTNVKPILDSLAEKFDDVMENHIIPMIEKAIEFLGKVMDAVKLLWDNVLSPFLTWFLQEMYPKVSDTLTLVGDVFFTLLGTVSDVAGGILEALGGVIDFLVGVFTGDWDKVWNGIESIFTGVWNGIVGALEGAVNLIIKGVNFLISQLNKLRINIPDNPLTGKVNIGFNIPKVSEVKLPRLANGAVIPPNQQFAAILGDQRNGTNIEAPLATIRQAVTEAIQAVGGVGGDINITVESVLDGKVIARNTVNHVNRMTRSNGRSPLLGMG